MTERIADTKRYSDIYYLEIVCNACDERVFYEIKEFGHLFAAKQLDAKVKHEKRCKN